MKNAFSTENPIQDVLCLLKKKSAQFACDYGDYLAQILDTFVKLDVLCHLPVETLQEFR